MFKGGKNMSMVSIYSPFRKYVGELELTKTNTTLEVKVEKEHTPKKIEVTPDRNINVNITPNKVNGMKR